MARTRNPNGMGNIYKRDNGRYEWTQMVDGVRRHASSTDLSELQEKIKKIADMPIVKSKLKVNEWFVKWLVNIESLKKPATYEQYRIMWEQHIEPQIGKYHLKNVKRNDIVKVIAEMNKKNLSSWTMKHARKVMHIAFEEALKNKYISENPVKEIEIPKKQAKAKKTMTIQELQIIFDELEKTRWNWCFRFMLVTGLRRGEILALTESDIDYKNRQIIIDESNSSSGLGDTKNSKVHYVPLSKEAIYYLGMQKEMLKLECNPVIFKKDLLKRQLIFPSKQGTLLKPDSLNSVLDRINKKTGLQITPHMYRHTFVYRSKGKLSLSELQEVLGHDESTTTLDIYGTMLSDTRSVADKIDSAFSSLDEEMKVAKADAEIKEKELAKVIQINKFKKAK